MKLCVLFIYALGMVATANASADESKDQSNTAQVQPAVVQATDASKVSTNQTVDEAAHPHDALKTQFLGKRPYMDTKAK